MDDRLRQSGIESLGEIPWGTHFCHFYLTQQDLMDTVVAFFRAGLENNEFCLWVLSAPLTVEMALQSLDAGIPDFSRHQVRGAVEILSYPEEGPFDRDLLIARWKEKLQAALARGFAGMRTSGDPAWLRKRDWREFFRYEQELDLLIADQRMIVSCSYPLDGTPAAEFLDAARVHQVAVALRNGSWEVVEPVELRQAKAEIDRLNGELEQRVEERTRELQGANEALRREILQREHLEESLRQAQQQTESILSSVADVHIILDREYRYRYVNNAAVRALGRPREEVLGRTLWELLPEIAGNELERQFRRAMEERVPVESEFHYALRDTWWENRFYPSPEGLAVFATEVTQRKMSEQALRESEELFRSYFELGLVGAAITSPDKRLVALNDKLAEIFGYEKEEMIRTDWVELVHPDDLTGILAQYERVLSGELEGYSVEARYFRKDGQIIWGAASVTCVREADGSAGYFVTHLQDITERKRDEERILAYQEQLRSMAAEVSLVEERERRKIATALHDQIGQRLAISAIKLGQLRQEVDSEQVRREIEEVRETVSEAIDQSRTLTFELSPPILYDLGLEAAVCSLAERFQKLYGVRIDCSDDHRAKPLSDDLRVLLFQGARELLVNAVKHAQARRINVSCRREGTVIKVAVEDDGVGLSSEEKYWRGPNHGFGLFSIHERLNYLGGNLVIRSAPGRGTEVELTAPLALGAENEPRR